MNSFFRRHPNPLVSDPQNFLGCSEASVALSQVPEIQPELARCGPEPALRQALTQPTGKLPLVENKLALSCAVNGQLPIGAVICASERLRYNRIWLIFYGYFFLSPYCCLTSDL